MNNTTPQFEQADKASVNHDDSQYHQALHVPRSPAYAALMSAILPGFGQLYNGQINKALWLFLIFCLVTVPLIAIIALYLPDSLIVIILTAGLLLTLAVWLYGVFDAWINARRSNHYQLKPWQTSGMYIAVFLTCCMLILPSLVYWVRDNQVQAFRIPSNSMSPTVLQGDMLFADKNYNCPGCRHSVSRGDVAIFIYPDNRNRHYIKRVLALPGDTVTIADQIVSINGKPLSSRDSADQKELTETIDNKSWQVVWDTKDQTDKYEITVSPGHAFVMGDNRSKSTDSRSFGLVPLSDIEGLSRQVWFSKDREGVRWSRLGQSVQPAKK